MRDSEEVFRPYDPRGLIFGKMAKSGMPFVLNGDYVVNHLTAFNPTGSHLSNFTVSGSWIGAEPQMQSFVELMNSCASDVNSWYHVKVRSRFDFKQPAILDFLDYYGRRVFTLSLLIEPSPFKQTFMHTPYAQVIGITLQRALADELLILSQGTVYQCAYSIYALYRISLSYQSAFGYRLLDIWNICLVCGYSLGSFGRFIRCRESIEKAYNNAVRIINKPDFAIMYDSVFSLVKPFILEIVEDLSWNGVTWVPYVSPF